MSFYMSFYVFINHPIVKHLLSILNISATVGLDSGHTSGAAVCPPRALAFCLTPSTTEDDGRWMKVVCNHCNLLANPWRHLWGRMQVCCIYQGQACILANFRRKNRHKDGQNMKDEEKSICSYLFFMFWCKDLVTLTILPLIPKKLGQIVIQTNQKSRTRKQQLWNFQVQSQYPITIIIIYHYILSHCTKISITRYSTHRPTPSGLYPWSSLRICRWETLQKGPIPGAFLYLWPQQVCLENVLFCPMFIHFARLLQWIFTGSLNASELFPMLCRQAIVPQAFPTYLGIGGSNGTKQIRQCQSWTTSSCVLQVVCDVIFKEI